MDNNKSITGGAFHSLSNQLSPPSTRFSGGGSITFGWGTAVGSFLRWTCTYSKEWPFSVEESISFAHETGHPRIINALGSSGLQVR